MPDSMRAEDIPRGVRIRAFMLLMVFEFFYGWSWNTVDVLRPQIRASLDLSLAQAGSAYTAQSLGALVGAVGFAVLADQFGRRRILFLIVSATAIMAALGALVESYPMLLAQRFVLGLFLGANFPVLIAIYMSLFAPDVRAKLTSIGQGTYSLAVMALGFAYGRYADQENWRHLLLLGSLPALAFVPLIFRFIPDDRRLIAWGAGEEKEGGGLPILELFTTGIRRRTLLLFLLVSINFFSYQAFAGWVTTYLQDVMNLGAEAAGRLVSVQFVGALLGGFFWGWFCDRFGRRAGSAGFFVAALAGASYLFLAASPTQLAIGGFIWGFAINASVAWAPWIAEMFPVRMRSSAMSIFNWGRIVSMTAPLLTGAMAESVGLKPAMALSVVGFAMAGIVWLMLPETLSRRQPRM